MGHFLLVVHSTQVSISNGFRDIPPQTSCAQRPNAESSLRNAHARYHVMCTPYVKFKYIFRNIYIFQFLTPTLPIHYVTLIGPRWRIIWGTVFSLWTTNVKGQIERKKIQVQNFAKEPWRSEGMKSCDFYWKGTSLRESTSFEPSCVKIGWGSDL